MTGKLVMNYSFKHDVSKAIRQAIASAGPALVAVLALAQTCSGLDAIVLVEGLTVGGAVTLAYRFLKFKLGLYSE